VVAAAATLFPGLVDLLAEAGVAPSTP
jgi:hypothetical protein